MRTAVPGAMTHPCSLDARGQFWDNRSTVKKQLVLATVLALSFTACQKSVDLGRVQDESLELVKVHVQVLDQLQRRADSLLQRGRSIGQRSGTSTQGIADAGRILTEARAQLDQLRAATQQAPGAIATAAKTGNDEEMYQVSDELVEKLEKGAALVRADLDAVEQWLAYAESRPAVPAAATPPPPAQPPVAPAQPPVAPAQPARTVAPATP